MPEKKRASFWRWRRSKEGGEGLPDGTPEESQTSQGVLSAESPPSLDLPDVPAFASLRGNVVEDEEPIPPRDSLTEIPGERSTVAVVETVDEGPGEADFEDADEDDDEDAPVLFGSLPARIAEEGPGQARLRVVAGRDSQDVGEALETTEEETALTGPPGTEVSVYLQESLGSLEAEAVGDSGQAESGVPGVGWRDEPEHWDSEDEAWKEITAEWAREDSSEEQIAEEIQDERPDPEPDAVEGEIAAPPLPEPQEPLDPPEPFPEEIPAVPQVDAGVEAPDPVAAPEVAEASPGAEAPALPEEPEPVEEPEVEAVAAAAQPEVEAVAAAAQPEVETAAATEKTEKEKRNLPVAVLTGAVFGAVAVGLLLAGPIYFAALAFALIVIVEVEFVNAVRKSGFQPAAILILAGTTLAFVAAAKQGAVGVAFGTAVVVAAASLWYAVGIIKTSPIANLASTVFGFCYLGLTGAMALTIMGFPDPPEYWRAIITFPVAVAVACDVGGYFGGARFGRHFVVKSISPRKSVEGYASSLVLALLVGAGFFVAGRLVPGSFSYWTLPKALIGAGVVFAASILGDLVESLLKRSLDLKDMSSILPGHGGMLDRIDSLLAAIPAFAAFLYFAGS